MNGQELDYAFVNGTAITLGSAAATAATLGVKGERIAYVGDAAGLRIGPSTAVIDLEGGAVLPGINDSHLHALMLGATRPPLKIDVSHPTVRSIADVVARLREHAARVPEGTWLVGTGWDRGFLEECRADPERWPTRWDLDAATPDHPVILDETYGHSSWVNSRALALAGIDASTQSPAGSVILKDEATGEPNGILQEPGAQTLVQSLAPGLDRAGRRLAIETAQGMLAELGITSYTEPALGPGGDGMLGGAFGAEGIDVYAELAAAGSLRARVNVLLLFGEPDGISGAEDIRTGLASYVPPDGADPRWLRIAGVKIFADGIPPSRTAWMNEPYEGGGHGSLVVRGDDDAAREAELRAMIAVAHAAGHQVGVHATGDRAIDATVDAFAAAQASDPRPDPRHYVIHGDFLSASTRAKLAAGGFGVNAQPAIKAALAEMLVDVIGRRRVDDQWPLRELIDAGATLCLSSDAPITFPDWRAGVASAVLRKAKASGRVSGPEHRITVLEALRGYTINGAWQDRAEDWKGSLAVGKVADLCVLGADPLTIDPEALPDVPVRLTMVGGRVVFDGR